MQPKKLRQPSLKESNLHEEEAQGFQYGFVGGRYIGENWLQDRPNDKVTPVEYRAKLFGAFQVARDRYVDRMKAQGKPVPKSIADNSQLQNLKTIDPPAPDFSQKRNMLHKFSGMCIKQKFTRWFVVDQQNLKYYKGEKDRDVKKTLELKNAVAFLEEKSAFNAHQKRQGGGDPEDEWTEPNQKYRVGIRLQGREMKPVYFYSEGLHDAKFLLVNIQMYGDQYNTMTMSKRVEMAYLIDKVTKFRKIINLLCLAKEKRFVAMHDFQQLAVDLIVVAEQAQEYRRLMAQKWVTNILEDDEKPILSSPFRSATPRPLYESGKLKMIEPIISKQVRKLNLFTRNRKLSRQAVITREIQKQASDESTGIPVETLTMESLNHVTRQYDRPINISRGQGSLIFDSEDSYKYMILENKNLDPQVSSATRFETSNRGQRQAENLIRKINLGDVSFISTDLNTATQFDFNNKITKQPSYRIRLYGPLRQLSKVSNPDLICPAEIGLDTFRKCHPKYRVSISKVKFPTRLASQSQSKITLFPKVYQFTSAYPGGPRCFESTCEGFNIKGKTEGIVFPDRRLAYPASFFINSLGNGDKGEYFSVGLEVRDIDKPIPLALERFKENHQEMKSHEQQNQTFKYTRVNQEHTAYLRDTNGLSYEVTFSIQELIAPEETRASEMIGKRLLVGRYVLYGGKVCFVKSLSADGGVEIIEVITKKERKVTCQAVDLIEDYGVSVFAFDREPELLKTSTFDWIIEMKVTDKRLLNQIHSKIQYRQAHLALGPQDTLVEEDLSSLEGTMKISLQEVKGLITADEMNRSKQLSTQIDPVVEIALEDFNGRQLVQETSSPIKNKRNVQWAEEGGEFIVDLGLVNHSGAIQGNQVEVQRSKKSTIVRKTVTDNMFLTAEARFVIHLTVRNAVNGQEIGEAKIEVDELVDPKLQDLAKEYCVCLNRSHLLLNKRNELIGGGKKKEEVEKTMAMFTQFSGLIRFQSLFQPTQDTSLRFRQSRETRLFKTPQQLLHFEYLVEKSDFDQFKYKIPRVEFNPNSKQQGRNLLDLVHLINQSHTNPKVQSLLKKLHSQENGGEQFMNVKLTDDLIRQIDQTVRFQSPFEKLYILLKLMRKERPFVEPMFFNFKNLWEIYTQVAKNQALDQLNLNEWLSFIDELSGANNFEDLNAIIDQAEHDLDNQDLDKSQFTQRSVSFVGDMMKNMKSKAEGLRKQSTLAAQDLDMGTAGGVKSFSLVLCQEWEREGNQTFIDLVQLIKGGIPQILRTVVWGDLLKANLIAIEEKKVLMKSFSRQFNKNLSTFENILDISQKYDSVAFRQIDQDIHDYKFPAYFYEETIDQNTGYNGNQETGETLATNRVNKLKQDKQKIRKLLRLLAVWGKHFKSKGTEYQFCYSTGFLKVVQRFVNLMTLEDAFWILIGFIKQFPRMWCLHDSSLLDDGKTNMRFEFTAMKAIVDVHFPKISAKLAALGLPLESLVYDSMTSLYSDFFHSDTLLKIWDMTIFYFNTNDQSSKRRGIWLLMAPSLLILALKHQQLEKARTAEEVISIYNEGKGIDYNPNTIISMLKDLIDEIFVLDGPKTSNFIAMATTGQAGDTSQVQSQTPNGILPSFFAQKKQSAPASQEIDDRRREFMTKQIAVFEQTRSANLAVSEFLFSKEPPLDVPSKKPSIAKANRPQRDSDDDLDFGDSKADESFSARPQSSQVLSYRSWRMEIFPRLQNFIKLGGEIVDDDLHEFEDTEIMEKQSLDIRVIHMHLHEVAHWNEEGPIEIQIQYGKLYSNGKFEVKTLSREDDHIRPDSNLSFFYNFKYVAGYNYLKIKLIPEGKKDGIGFCFVDLRGLVRSQYITLTRQMTNKESLKNPESQFALARLKVTLFLEPKEPRDQDEQMEASLEKTSCFNSLKKAGRGLINIYNSKNEVAFQKMVAAQFSEAVSLDYRRMSQFLKPESLVDMIRAKYGSNVEVAPLSQFGQLSQHNFVQLIDNCFPDYYKCMSTSQLNSVYRNFTKRVPKKEGQEFHFKDFASLAAVVDSERSLTEAQIEQLSQVTDETSFSLRQFLLSVILQSPMTVKEKLDVLFDLTDLCNSRVEGIELQDVFGLYQSIMLSHQYYLPPNELRTQMEMAYAPNSTGIIGAFWTRRMMAEVKYDMDQTEANGFMSLESFLEYEADAHRSGVMTAQQKSKQFSIIDVTSEVCRTLAAFENLFGSKKVDLNENMSPFANLNIVLSGKGQTDLGAKLMAKVQELAQPLHIHKYRLCLLSQVMGGERTVTEVFFDPNDLQLVTPASDEEGLNLFKKVFLQQRNILDLTARETSISKSEFIRKTLKMPFVYDMMRAETLWQDRKHEAQGQKKATSLKMKTRFQPVVSVFLSDKDKIFIFKFESKVMGGGATKVKELVPRQIYLFEAGSLYMEDIILDMRDKIVTELEAQVQNGLLELSPGFTNEIEGKMEFHVRKVLESASSPTQTEKEHVHQSVVRNTSDLRWLWKNVYDFDRLEKFSDDEVYEDEVVFKLVKNKGSQEVILDERPVSISEGYDCFSIYKHSDNSYEWRLCKIVGQEKKPEFKAMATSAFLDLHSKYGGSQKTEKNEMGCGSVHESDQFYYYLEFYHLREQGKAMWVKRRREDVVLSNRFARSQQSFEGSCYNFIMDTYGR